LDKIATRILLHFFFAISIFLMVELPFANDGFAAVHSVTATGHYEMGETDSISIAKQKALDEAKRNAAEQVGVYVESETVVEENKVTKDTITLMTAQFIHIQGEPVWKREPIGDFGTRLTVTIHAYIDDGDLNILQKKINDKLTLKNYEELQSNYDKLQKDNQNLKLQLATIKKEEDNKRIEKQLLANDEIYQANNYMIDFLEHNRFDSDRVNKCKEIVNKVHLLVDKNLSIPAAIPVYLDLGTMELTLETWQLIENTNSFNSKFERLKDPVQIKQLKDEVAAYKKNQAQRYYDISTNYINFAESLPDSSDYLYKKYSALVGYYGSKAVGLKMKEDFNGASIAIKRAEHYTSLIPKSSIYYDASLRNIQAVKNLIHI